MYQGGVKSTVSGVFENLKFKISEDYKQNWSFPVSAMLVVLGHRKFIPDLKSVGKYRFTTSCKSDKFFAV